MRFGATPLLCLPVFLPLLTPTALAAPSLHALGFDQADDQYRVLLGLSERGLFDLVLKESEDFLKTYPGHALAQDVRYRRASAFFELGRLAEAVPLFQSLGNDARFAFAAEANLRLGQCSLELGEVQNAIAALERALQSGKQSLQAHALFYLGQAESARQRPAAAELHYNRLLALVEHDERAADYRAEAERALVWCAFDAADWSRCVERAESLLARRRRQPLSAESASEFEWLRGESLRRLEQLEPAQAAFTRVTSGPYRDAALRGAGLCAANLGASKQVLVLFGQLLEQYPQSPYRDEAHLQRAAALLTLERAREALLELDACSQSSSEVRYWRARSLAAMGEPAGALAELDAALAGAGLDSSLRARVERLRGEQLVALGQWEQATGAFAAAGSPESLLAVAVERFNAADLPRAAELARALLQLETTLPVRAQAEMILAEERLAAQDYGAALSAFDGLARGQGPDSLRARAQLRAAWSAYLSGDVEAAAQRCAQLREAWSSRAKAQEFQALLSECRELEARTLQDAMHGALEAQDYARAAQLAQAHLALVPGSLTSARDRIFALYQLGQYAPAAESAAKLFETQRQAPGEADAALLADCAELWLWSELARKELDAARTAWSRLATLPLDESRRVTAMRAYARALSAAGRLSEGIACIDSCLPLLRERENALAALLESIWLGLEQSQLEVAEPRLKVAARIAPEDLRVNEAAFHLGERHLGQEQWNEAAQMYACASVAPQSPTQVEALYKQAYALVRLDRGQEACAALLPLLEDPRLEQLSFGAEALFLLGEASYQAGDDASAARAMQRVLELSAEPALRGKALFRLGGSAWRTGQYESALVPLEELAHSLPDFEELVEADWMRARALLALGRKAPAQELLETIVARDRGLLAARARLELAALAQARGDLDEALAQALRVALLGAPAEELGEALWLAGQCLEAQSKPTQALSQYRELLTKLPLHARSAAARERSAALAGR